jgi:hypothetical protein
MIVDLAGLPKEAIYSIVDEGSKTFHVNYTLSMGNTLNRVYDMVGGRPTLKFRVLVATSDPTTLKLQTEYYRNMYIALGYTEMMGSRRKTLQYRVRVVVAPDFKGMDVQLVSARGDGFTVGRFATKIEARVFALEYYGDNPYRFPVYSTNSLTRELLERERKPGRLIL